MIISMLYYASDNEFLFFIIKQGTCDEILIRSETGKILQGIQ